MPYEILTGVQMAEADRLAIESGIPGFTLMQNAGKAAADIIIQHYKKGQALVLCGPGNNGGDGFIIATHLKKAGWKVRLASLEDIGDIKGDAAQAALLWKGPVESFYNIQVQPAEIVVDAVFGTGFSREIKEPVIKVFQNIRDMKNPVIAIDIPSGVNGGNAQADPNSLEADLTITFCRKKIGHVLEPAKSMTGQVVVCDIGIPDHIVSKAGHVARENHAGLWIDAFPHKVTAAHKYDYGHAVIFGAEKMTGATRLAAESCARIGAGLTTILAQGESAFVYRAALPPHFIVEDVSDNIYRNLEDARRNAFLIGPGAGKDYKAIMEVMTTICELKRKVVMDADALNALAETRAWKILHSSCVLTPHEGEFTKLFPDLKGTKLEKAVQAADITKCTLVLKGGDTIIAAPDGRVIINTNAPPNLATAGTGDVLAGMITGLLAQKMSLFEAACAAVWVHGECARRIGPGLVASDIPARIPQVLRDLVL